MLFVLITLSSESKTTRQSCDLPAQKNLLRSSVGVGLTFPLEQFREVLGFTVRKKGDLTSFPLTTYLLKHQSGANCK